MATEMKATKEKEPGRRTQSTNELYLVWYLINRLVTTNAHNDRADLIGFGGVGLNWNQDDRQKPLELAVDTKS